MVILTISLYTEKPFLFCFYGFNVTVLSGLIFVLLGRFLPETVVKAVTGPVGEYLLYTLAAQVMVLPLMIYYFSNLSLISLLANSLILLSVAAGDRDGQPDPDALQAVAGYNLPRTDQHGWIELSTDGERLWVEAER